MLISFFNIQFFKSNYVNLFRIFNNYADNYLSCRVNIRDVVSLITDKVLEEWLNSSEAY